MSNKFDIVIIGSGNGGFGVYAIAAEAGKSIAFVESLDFGGTCPNRGCTPKKVLVAAAQSLETIANASVHGIDVGPAKLDWAKLIDRETDMVSGIPAGMQGLAEKRGTVFHGEAKFVGPNSVEVGGTILEADNIVIATGSKPRDLPIPGADLMITSDEVLKAEAERIGITVKTGVSVNEISWADGRLQVAYAHDSQDLIVTADHVVNGAGRIANVDALDLDAGNIAHDGVSIDVDEYLRSTSNPAVWVVGDALTISPQLSPVATYEGRIVGRIERYDPRLSDVFVGCQKHVLTGPAVRYRRCRYRPPRCRTRRPSKPLCNPPPGWRRSALPVPVQRPYRPS